MPADPTRNFRFTSIPLAIIHDAPVKGHEVARVFFGEWLELHPEIPAQDGHVYVAFRGGHGWVKADELETTRKLEVYFIDVGQGDSILIQTPDDKRVLIDGGPGKQAFQFIANKYRLDKKENYVDFEAVILTHSRVGDRTVGLTDLPEQPGLSDHMQRLARAIETAKAQLPAALEGRRRRGFKTKMPEGGFVCRRADVKQGIIPPFEGGNGKVRLEVLWPEATRDETGAPTYRWYSDAGRTKNGNCVVLRLAYGKRSLLLAGDLNVASMRDVVNRWHEKLDATVYKAAHHGSDDFALEFLKAVKPDAAVITSGDDANSKFGHPRAVLLGTVTRYSKCEEPGVFSTELARCYQPLSGDELEAFKGEQGQHYEKSIEGVIHLRSDGERIMLGRVFGRAMLKDGQAQTNFQWDTWQE